MAAPGWWRCVAFEATAPAGGCLRWWRRRPRRGSSRRRRRAGRCRQPRERRPEPEQQRRTPKAAPTRSVGNGRLAWLLLAPSHWRGLARMEVWVMVITGIEKENVARNGIGVEMGMGSWVRGVKNGYGYES